MPKPVRLRKRLRLVKKPTKPNKQEQQVTQVPAETSGTDNLPASVGDYQFNSTGLEDFEQSDSVLPRIKIDHPEGVWVDTLGGARMLTLRFIALGLVKQRVLFHHVVDDDDVPMCKSSNFETGFPNPDAPNNKSFPWQISGFEQSDYPPDQDGNVKLPCSGCQLKEWGSNPASDAPYCSEQWTLPIYYDTSEDFSGDWSPAILTLQKSSIKPIRTYFTSFAQSNKPPFITTGRATLKVVQRGSVKYSTPSFVKEGESPRERWQEFSEQFGDMKSFLTRPPVRDIDGATPAKPTDNTYNGPGTPAGDPWATQPPVQQQPVQTQPPVQQQPVQTQPPVQQQPIQTQPPVQQQPVQQSTPEPAGNELPF